MQNTLTEMLRESAAVKTALAETMAAQIAHFAEWMTETYRGGGKVVLFGNGGSMCDANHIAEELVGRYKMERRALPAMAFSETSVITALANDYGYDTIFRRQVEAWVTAKDLTVGLTTSGRSVNVREGLRLAREKGARTVALTGAGGESLSDVSDLVIVVPTHNVPRIQECHITIGHIVCEITERAIFGGAA
ncbi:MAG TPA: SIS domain-containing protein [Armatimonadota bacterium]|jgi:D-sedoheptulose 7-phosphate isomerase